MTSQFFIGTLGCCPPSGAPCFGGRWRLSATFDRRLTANVHVAEEHRPHPHPATQEAPLSGRGGLYGCIPSFLLPDGHALTYHQHRAILPPALGHLAVQTAPAHKSNRQRVSVGLGGQECWPACAVQHIQSTSPQTPAYLTSQS